MRNNLGVCTLLVLACGQDTEPVADMAADSATNNDAGVDGPYTGPDGRTADARIPDGGCECPEILDPVCGSDGETYDNDCFAECAGVLLACEGHCPCPGCDCPSLYDPVCGSDGETYANVCEAECVNIVISCEGACPCEEPCDPASPATCPTGYACICGGPGALLTCRCGLTCTHVADCTNLNQPECCNESVCTDPCTCYCD